MRLNMESRVLLPIIFLVLAGPGCAPSGPRTYPVSGTVSYDGDPIVQGDILFVPADRSLAPDAAKIEDGRFHAQAKEGECRVEISALDIGPDTNYVMGSPIAANFLPERYNRQSELSVEVSAKDDNIFDFALTSDAGTDTDER